MAGILADQMTQDETVAAVPVEGEVAEEEQTASTDEQVTPEEQKAFDQVETAAIAIAYDDKTHADIMKSLANVAENPAKTMATVAMDIFLKIDEEAGGQIPETVIMRGLEVALDVVIEMVEKTGTGQIDENTAGSALQQLIILAGDKYDFDPAEVQEFVDNEDPTQVQEAVAQQEAIAGGVQNGTG